MAIVSSFLSDEWIESLRSLGNELPKVKDASVSCQHEISATPDGKVRFYTIWEDGRLVGVDKGKYPDPDCTITVKYPDALDILHGRKEPEVAFMQGDLKVEGNYRKLLMDLSTWRQSNPYRKMWQVLSTQSE